MSNIFNIIIILVGIILIVYVIYLLISYFRNNSKTVEKLSLLSSDSNNIIHSINDKVLIFKTHIWHDELESFAKKIENETVPNNVDYYILMHSDDYTLKNKIVDTSLRNRVLMYSEAEIKKMYDKGFYSMWLCNHWILMWFFKKYPNYRYYWSMEYDVRIVGNSSKIWLYPGNQDFLYPVKPFQDPNWIWRNHYSGTRFNNSNKWYGYLQLTRYSNKFLNYLDYYFNLNENGQDEMVIFSIFKHGISDANLTGSHKLLNSLINDSWSVSNDDNDKHKKLLRKSHDKYKIDKNHLQIFHPIK